MITRRIATAVTMLVCFSCGGGKTPDAAYSTSSKGKLKAFSVAPASGKLDKVGPRDGALAPDGVNDLVFTAVLEGPAVAIVVVSVDAAGLADGALHADTYVGEQAPPLEVSSDVRIGKRTFGLGVYEGDVLVNAQDGSLPAFADGPHELTLFVSSPDAPKGRFRAFAVFDDRTVSASPIAR